MPTAAETREKYLREALAAGCPADQVRHFAAAGIVLQPRQLAASAAARLCDRPCDHGPETKCHAGCAPTEVGYGGARGGGKSHWGLAQIMCDDGARYPGLKMLYLRKVGKSGTEAIHDLRREVLHSTPHRFANNVLAREDNGSRVVLGHFQHEKDIDNYLGLQYDGVLIEEATQLSSRKVRDITTCVRTTKAGWRPRKYFTTNPGNIGHAWFLDRFIKPARTGRETTGRFIQATVRDNAFVNVEYRAELESLTGWQRRAWLDGDWDIAAGQFFTLFRRDVHVLKEHPRPTSAWTVWLCLDYGLTHYTACYLLGLDGDGVLHYIDEHSDRGKLIEWHAAKIHQMLERNGVPVNQLRNNVAGADCFAKRHTGGTIADEYKRLGLVFKPANDDRINGAAEMARRLGDPDGGIAPTLFIGPRCGRLAECIPTLEHDPHRPEDVLKVDTDADGIGGDDWYDAARYGCMVAANRKTFRMLGQ